MKIIMLLAAIILPSVAFADVSDSGNLSLGGQAIIVGTTTVQGNAFSVGTSTLVVTNGKIGIGTNSPAGPLDVQASGNFTTYIGTQTSPGVIYNRQLVVGGNGGSGGIFVTGAGTNTGGVGFLQSGTRGAEIQAYQDTDNQHTGMLFYTSNGSPVNTTAMKMKSDGKIGIGTSSPNAMLHVSSSGTIIMDGNNSVLLLGKNPPTGSLIGGRGSGFANGVIALDTNASQIQSGMRMYANGTRVWDLGTNLNKTDDRTLEFYDAITGITAVAISTADKVGIGTTSPAQALHVVGTIRQTAVTSCTLGLTTNASGDINGCSASDQRLKTKTRELGSSGTIIDGLTPHYYVWIDTTNKDAQEHVGFIAQEVASVLPQAVTQAGTLITPSTYTYTVRDLDGHPHIRNGPAKNGGPLYGIDPNALIAVLLKEVQDLRKRVAVLESKK